MTMESMESAQLADFLRRRRHNLQPRDMGLGPGRRRRTAGLRREEVALLADMSVDYYSRLEQQRASQPSPQMVAAIARALQLSADERDHHYRLAGHNAPHRAAPADRADPGLLRMLERLESTPAQVLSDLGEVLAQNALAVALVGDHTRHTGMARSFIWRWFTDPSARGIYPRADHEHHSRAQVAELRAALSRRGHDAPALALVQDLYLGSAEFARLWDAHEVAVRWDDHKRIVHPELGLVELDCQNLVAEGQGQRLLILSAPAGSEGAAQLAQLAQLARTASAQGEREGGRQGEGRSPARPESRAGEAVGVS